MQSPAAKLGIRALLVLTLINMFNYIDRYIVPPLFESLRKDPVMGHPSDARLGGLMTAFLVVYMVTSPLFGTLGDRMSRMRLIAFGVALWSVATAIGGLVGSFVALFVAGVPGLLLALLAFAVPDPPRGMWDGEPRAKPDPIQSKFAFALHSYGALARNRTYVLTCAGLAAYTFALGGIATWLPSFLERIRGVSHAQASSLPGAILVVT